MELFNVPCVSYNLGVTSFKHEPTYSGTFTGGTYKTKIEVIEGKDVA